MLRSFGAALSLAGLLVAAPSVAAQRAPAPVSVSELVILPPDITLTGAKARQQVIVVQREAAAYTGDLTAAARFASSDPSVATVTRAGLVRPVADGVATITARVGEQTVETRVRVERTREPFTWSFTNHVQSVLTKSGCNQGACHGAEAGKGGLKLTLRGYDPEADYTTLTRQVQARRVSLAHPEESLVLQKATMGIPHGGGPRFRVNSREYGVIQQWIQAGAPAPPAPPAAEPKIVRLEVYPAQALLMQGDEQQIVVRAVFNDGHHEDVTPWVKYGSSDDTVADVDEDGRVTVTGHGEAAVTIWYLNEVAFARITSPHPNAVDPQVWRRAQRHSFIDDLTLKKLRELQIAPAGLVDDRGFIRRAYLDAAGILPSPAEVDAFLADPRPDKRARLVDTLLERPEFVDYWTYRWSDLLLVSSRKLPGRAMRSFYGWIRDSVEQNVPWDRFVREIITASGSTLQNGAANYYVLHKDPIGLTETTTQAFLGMSLTCARCHNHPLEKWTQNQYYAMANLFARVRLKNGDLPGETLVLAADYGDLPHPRMGKPMPPAPLDGEPMALEAVEDRRGPLAEWLTSAENPYFTRALVNRVWRNFMGRGLVEAEDDLRLTNPPSNEELMDALTAEFVKQGFDVRALIRTIMTSASYQRRSEATPGSEHDQIYYSSYIPRRLPAEVMLDTISQVTGIPTEFAGYPKGTRALQLPDSQVASYFLEAFGRAPREQTCSCERQDEPSVLQALHLTNGDTINNKLRAPAGTVERLLEEGLADEAVIERVYLIAFSRKPTAGESERVLKVLRQYQAEAAAEDESAAKQVRREVVEDLFAALLTSKEFLFNH
jgi:hypothetical protein